MECVGHLLDTDTELGSRSSGARLSDDTDEWILSDDADGWSRHRLRHDTQLEVFFN